MLKQVILFNVYISSFIYIDFKSLNYFPAMPYNFDLIYILFNK